MAHLHATFSFPFEFLAERVKAAWPQYRLSLQFFSSNGILHRFPTYDDCASALRDVSSKMRSLNDSIQYVTVGELELAWANQFDGCKSAIKRCEILFKNVQQAIGQAETETRFISQEQRTRESNDAAMAANNLSREANNIATAANDFAQTANDLSSSANATAIKSKEIAERAEETAKRIKWWTAGTAIVAVAAIGWDYYKWHDEKHKTESASPTAQKLNLCNDEKDGKIVSPPGMPCSDTSVKPEEKPKP